MKLHVRTASRETPRAYSQSRNSACVQPVAKLRAVRIVHQRRRRRKADGQAIRTRSQTKILLMKKLSVLSICLAISSSLSTAGAQNPETDAVRSPYAGQEGREIKSLSSEEIAGLLAGEGMGFAKAAELNHYPGPRHVLDLLAELNLDENQHEAAQEIFSRMNRRAVELGEQLVALERELDDLFVSRSADEESLRSLVSRWGELQGALRFAHLKAHLEMTEILDQAQRHRYVQLRGYLDGGNQGGHDAHDH